MNKFFGGTYTAYLVAEGDKEDAIKKPDAMSYIDKLQNHLEGLNDNIGASGLGQFSYFSFYEVNNHLERFNKDNLSLLLQTHGKDVRPIELRKNDIYNPSSYYFIPTAVVSSASYLNNRYLQLKNVLKRQNIPYSPDLLWLYSAMAYNKGTRSVLSFWNDSKRRHGKRHVEKLVLDLESFLTAVLDPVSITRSLQTIWPNDTAVHYAKELRIHMQKIKECALSRKRES
jgi:hypothetical protein